MDFRLGPHVRSDGCNHAHAGGFRFAEQGRGGSHAGGEAGNGGGPQGRKGTGAAAQQTRITKLLEEMQADLSQQGETDLVDIDIRNRRLTLPDKVFARGSACITDEARQALNRLSTRVATFVSNDRQARVLVEGHTDNVQVSRPVVDFNRFCTVYDDNFTLSAARAREARKLLIQALNEEQAKRVIVAGYGDSHPLEGKDPGDARNRRVEIQLSPSGSGKAADDN